MQLQRFHGGEFLTTVMVQTGAGLSIARNCLLRSFCLFSYFVEVVCNPSLGFIFGPLGRLMLNDTVLVFVQLEEFAIAVRPIARN
jgi:hypothetical protein